MSDTMSPLSFDRLMKWLLSTVPTGTIFGLRHMYEEAKLRPPYLLFHRPLSLPFGPAAGPHTQLAQNMATAYAGGARFFELKTVQVIDGPALHVEKPCITAAHECYNVEWSTELTVPQAFAEYVKAWFLIHVLILEYGYGRADGFQFNMSVGYDLKGIKTEKIDSFIEQMKDASKTPIFQECKNWLAEHLSLFQHLTTDAIESISPHICNAVTVSTMHGCPPAEIERIATYLLQEKKLHTFVKCNPTLLGYDTVKTLLRTTGYGYISFSPDHFTQDLQYSDAVPMLRRLQNQAKALGLTFGVKLTNTFPVTITKHELPGTEMYMSGKPLFFLSLAVAQKLAQDFQGTLPMSYSGGADAHNISSIVGAGIWPVTVATTLLKPGGYERLPQLAQKVAGIEIPQTVDAEKITNLLQDALHDPYYQKPKRAIQHAPVSMPQVPLLDCFTAPCQSACPLGQDIPTYMTLVQNGKYEQALRVILDKNPLPFITGTICYHSCTNYCNRRFYDTPVHIRATKLLAATKGYDAILHHLPVKAKPLHKTAVVLGGGPAGLAVAYFLARSGMTVTIREKEKQCGGLVRSYLCQQRHQITEEAIDKDVALVKAMGVHIIIQAPDIPLWQLRKDYDYVIFAVGPIAAGLLKPAKNAAQQPQAKGRIYADAGLSLTAKDTVFVEADTNLTSLPGVYAIGDGRRGVSSVALAIHDAQRTASAIIGKNQFQRLQPLLCSPTTALQGRGCLCPAPATGCDTRCLHCDVRCEQCVEVCPNRANMVISTSKGPQILHLDALCNECGNCATFCPWSGAPYRHKFTLFPTYDAMLKSQNPGFTIVNRLSGTYNLRLQQDITLHTLTEADASVSTVIRELIRTIIYNYSFLL